MPDTEEMAASSAPPNPGRPLRRVHPLEIAIVVIVGALDQVTKAIVRQTLPLGDSRNVIPNLLDFTHVHNTGAAFGLLNGVDFPYKPAVMIGVAGLALVAIAVYATQLGFQEKVARVGLALILGGALGNLVDRAVLGYVVDFVDVYRGTLHFWAFNVADAAITAGAVLVILDMMGLGRRHASDPV